jgi:hypothetical protein
LVLHAGNSGEQRAYHPGLLRLIVGLAADLGLRAAGRLHCCAWRALLLWWALDHGATGTGARWARANLAGLVARADARRAGRNRGLQDVLGHVRRRRALGLEHVTTHVGLGRAWGDAGLQNILGPVNLGATITVTIVASVAALAAALATAIILWLAADITR